MLLIQCVTAYVVLRELMEKEGIYHELFTTQARRYIENDTDAIAHDDRPPMPQRPHRPRNFD